MGRDVKSELGHSWGFSKPDELNRLSEAIMLYTHTIYLGIYGNCSNERRQSVIEPLADF